MPSQLLHTLFGEDIAAGLCSGTPKICGFERINTVYRGIFSLGCQGPDIFYHNRRTRPSALEYGVLLHRRNYGIFCKNIFSHHSGITIPDINIRDIYALGFMTHAILDRFCHPCIVYKSSNAKGIYHPFFERIIDVLMFKALRDQEIVSWDQGLLADNCESLPVGLKGIIARALAAAFPEKANRDKELAQRIDNALADSARYYRLSDPSQTCLNVWNTAERPIPVNSRFLSLVFPENLPSDIDFLNLKKEPWYYPCHPAGSSAAPQQDTRSFPEIYADAVKAAVNFLSSGMIHTLDIGNGCLSIHDENGKPCVPNLVSPLPLDEVLQAQCRMRC